MSLKISAQRATITRIFRMILFLGALLPGSAAAEITPAVPDTPPPASETATEESASRITIGAILYDIPENIQEPEFLQKLKEIQESSLLRTGDVFRSEQIQEEIRLLFQSGLFSQVKVFKENRNRRMDLRFLLVPKIRIDGIDFAGNDTFPSNTLMRAIRLRNADTFFEQDLEEEYRRIRAFYGRRGFTDVQVEAKQVPTQSRYHVNLLFRIAEGPFVKIQSITFQGDPFFRKRKLTGKFPLRKGQRVDVDRIREGIRKLKDYYRKAGFEEARIELQEENEADWRNSPLFKDGKVRIAISAGRKIRVRFIGNRHYGLPELRRALKLEKIDVISYGYGTLQRMRNELESFYQRRGYLNVSVRTSVLTKGKRRKYVTFNIYEGNRVKLENVRFRNNRKMKGKTLSKEFMAFIRDQLATEDEDDLRPPDTGVFDRNVYRFQERASKLPRRKLAQYARPEDLDTDEVFLPEVFEKAVQSLTLFYRENGFLSCRIEGPLRKFNGTGQRLTLTYTVAEGVQTRVRTIDYQGFRSLEKEKIREIVKIQPGNVLNDLAFDKKKREIEERYAQEGFIHASVKFSYTLAENDTVADVRVSVAEGPLVRIGNILVSGLQKTRKKTVLQELSFKKNDVYRPKKMEDSQYWLQKLRIFQAVTLKPWNPEKIEEIKAVVVSVRERNPGSFELSTGIATDDGVRAGLGFVYRNLGGLALEFHTRAKVNHRIPALLDDQFAKIYRRQALVDALERNISLGIYYPSIVGSHIGLRTDLVHLREQERAYGLDKNSLIFGFDTEPIRRLTLAQVNEIAYLDSLSTTLSAIREDEIIPPDGRTLEFSPKFQIVFDHRDNLFNPTKGILVSGLAEYFETIEGEINADLFRGSAAVSGYIPIPISRRIPVLRLTAKGGAIANVTSVETPADKRFKLGGRMSLRGFGEEAAYPADLTAVQKQEIRDEDIPSPGGDLFLLFKVDLRYPIYKSYYLGAFVDSGNLWIDPSNIDFRLDKYKNSAGGGVHYRTPVGDISLELGWNLNPNKELKEESWRLHFSISLF